MGGGSVLRFVWWTDLGGDPMVEGGGVGLLPALCLLRMACVLFTLLTESSLLPSSGTKAVKEVIGSIRAVVYVTAPCSAHTHTHGPVCVSTTTITNT